MLHEPERVMRRREDRESTAGCHTGANDNDEIESRVGTGVLHSNWTAMLLSDQVGMAETNGDFDAGRLSQGSV